MFNESMSLSMTMSIHIAHKRETSNALYALVRSKHKRFHVLPKCLNGYAYLHKRRQIIKNKAKFHDTHTRTKIMGKARAKN